MGNSYDDYCDMIDSMDWLEPMITLPMPRNDDDEDDAIEAKEY